MQQNVKVEVNSIFRICPVQKGGLGATHDDFFIDELHQPADVIKWLIFKECFYLNRNHSFCLQLPIEFL